MVDTSLDAFRAELSALQLLVSHNRGKTVRNEELRERFRTLFRSWTSVVEPEIREHLATRREFFKLTSELERLAQLASRRKPVADYKKRLAKAIQLADSLVVYVPTETPPQRATHLGHRDDLFIPSIPDLPVSLVPNAIVGWRSRLEGFIKQHPFDTSVFIMIRYRRRNEQLVSSLRRVLRSKGLCAVLASDHEVTDDLYNPIACLLCCSMGIAIFDKGESQQEFNPNVAYELGMLHLLGRSCLILKHSSLRTLHTDILMKLYTPYASPQEASEKAAEWAEQQVQTP